MKLLNWVLLLALLFALPMGVNAANTYYKFWQSPRDYEPVVLKVAHIPGIDDTRIDRLYIYSYNADADTWRQIPFQFDKSNGGNTFRAAVPDDKFWSEDEIIIMARDLGDLIHGRMCLRIGILAPETHEVGQRHNALWSKEVLLKLGMDVSLVEDLGQALVGCHGIDGIDLLQDDRRDQPAGQGERGVGQGHSCAGERGNL